MPLTLSASWQDPKAEPSRKSGNEGQLVYPRAGPRGVGCPLPISAGVPPPPAPQGQDHPEVCGSRGSVWDGCGLQRHRARRGPASGGGGGAGRSAHLPSSLCLRRPASSSAGKEAQSAGGSRPPTAAALLRTPPLGPGPEPSSEPRSRGADSPRATPGGRGAGGVRPGPRAPAALCLCLRTRVQNLPPDTQETWLSPVQ